MSTNNNVYSVLVPSGNQAMLAAGQGLDNLLPGQLGVMDAETHLAIDGSKSVKNFYLTLGVDTDGDGTKDAVKDSAGQHIQLQNMRAYNFRPHTAARPMILEISDIVGRCDTDYGIRLEFRNNEIYRRQGAVQFSKTYAFRSKCCDTCGDCPSVDSNLIVQAAIAAINADGAGLVIAEALHPTTNAVITDIPAFITANKTVNTDENKTNDITLKIRLTSVPTKINKFCNVNLKYYHPRQTVLVASLVEGFECNGTVKITQEAAFEEGAGYDVKQKEYQAGNWNGNPGPYKLSEATGTARHIEYFAQDNVKYDQFYLRYDFFSVAGWLEHLNNLGTFIAIPTTDATTRNGLAAILDGLFTPLGFDALADDSAAANADNTAVETTESKDNTALDGLG